MKRTLILLLKIILIIVVLITGLSWFYKTKTKANMEKKVTIIKTDWDKVLKLKDENNLLLEALLTNSHKDIQYKDSLGQNIAEYNRKWKNASECTESFVYHQYLSNKYMLPLLKFYAEDSLINEVEKNKLRGIHENIDNLNSSIETYNRNARDFNFYFTPFPNFLIGKSAGYNNKNYFEISFGIENIDPDIARKERMEEFRKIDKEHGISE